MENARFDALQRMLHGWLQDQLKAQRARWLKTLEEAPMLPPVGEDPTERILQLVRSQDPHPTPRLEEDLGAALDLLESATSQGGVLKRLLEGLQPFVERSALFVVKDASASLYVHRGFSSDQVRPGLSIALSSGLEALVRGEGGVRSAGSEAYRELLKALGGVEAVEARVMPLRLHQRTVALLLVDGGAGALEHLVSVRLLARAAEAVLAMQGTKKEKESSGSASASTGIAEPTPRREAAVAPSPATRVPVAPDVMVSPTPSMDPKIRANAERSARVLVGDIELYFPGKVAEGLAEKKLYGRLKEELDRSKQSFVERYGEETEQIHHIFYDTVVQQLCGGDAALLGSVPWGRKV